MQEEVVYTISDLNDTISSVLSLSFPQSLYIQGEISNFKSASSGHWYFSLKDESSQIKAVMFKQANKTLKTPKDGDKVLVYADINFYKGRGECQLVCKTLSPLGIGSLLAKLEALKHKLASEGIFDLVRKKSLPVYPKRIGIVTSSQAAALQDMLKIFYESHISAEIYIFSCLVQGEHSSKDIINKLTQAYNFEIDSNKLDIIILSRGGGSTEDLLSFSDEQLVRKIVESPIPIITGIGHQIDVSLADLAADIHEPTPTAAAKVVCEQVLKLHEHIKHIHNSILTDFKYKFDYTKATLIQFSPSNFFKTIVQALANQKQTVDKFSEAIKFHTIQTITNIKQKLIYIHNQIEYSSPQNILEKGFAIVKDSDTQKIINKRSATRALQHIDIQLVDGLIHAQVKSEE